MIKNVPVNIAADLMGKGGMFVRCGLRAGRFPFGVATLGENGRRWNYHISAIKLADYLGIQPEQIEDACGKQ